MGESTLSSGNRQVPYMPMTAAAVACAAPIMPDEFDDCLIPGGVDLWQSNGFYSPGECFDGYIAQCTQTASPEDEWPVRRGETVVRCIPAGYECNGKNEDQKYATTIYGGTTLSAPAFEIRWTEESAEATVSKDGFPNIPSLTLPPDLSITLPTMPTITPGATRSSTHITATTTSKHQDTSTSTSTSTSSNQTQSDPGLSTGDIAALASGLGAGALVAGALAAWWLMRRRRKSRAGAQRLEDDPEETGVQPFELDHKPMERKELPAETARPVAKVRATGPYAEVSHISVNDTPVELAADSVQTHSNA